MGSGVSRYRRPVSWQLVALVIGVVATVVPPRRVPALRGRRGRRRRRRIVQVVPLSAFGDALDALAAPLAFLLVAVPLAVVLDEVGFFSSLAALVDGGPPPAPRAVGARRAR